MIMLDVHTVLYFQILEDGQLRWLDQPLISDINSVVRLSGTRSQQ